MARIWYVTVDSSGFDVSFLVVANTDTEARQRMSATIKHHRIDNGGARVKEILPFSGRHYDQDVYRLVRDDSVLPDKLRENQRT